MRGIRNDDKPGFVAEKPEHCYACYQSFARVRRTISQSRTLCTASAEVVTVNRFSSEGQCSMRDLPLPLFSAIIVA